MKKFVKIFLILFIFILCKTEVNALVISGGGYPGKGSVPSNGATGGTVWKSPIVKAIRFRVFRADGTRVDLGDLEYYSIANTQSECYESLEALVCETDGYKYKSLIYKTYAEAQNNASKCSSKTLTFGCLAAHNLNETFRSKDGVWTWNGNYLANFLEASEYSNLKKMLENHGYGEPGKEVRDGDYVIIEPATRVTCANSYYFGTSTALMLKNVSYSGILGYNQNMCDADDSYDGYTFVNLFRYMSSAIKVASNEDAVYPSPSVNPNADYSEFGYFKYDVSDIGYSSPNGDLRVEIYIDGTDPKKLITSDSLKFDIISGHGCTGTPVERELSTGNSGFKTKTLKTGNYSVKITKEPSSNVYQRKQGENYTCRNVTLTPSGYTVSIPYEKGCVTELNEKINSYTIEDAVYMYNKYGYNGLLTTTNPTCSAVDCTNKNGTVGCLSAILPSNISSNNLVCSDIITDKIGGDAVAFCEQTFNLTNNLILNGNPITTFYGISGGLLIKKDGTSLYKVYSEDRLPQYISSQNGIATAIAKKTCYVIRGKNLPVDFDSSVSGVGASLDGKELNASVITLQNENPVWDGIFDVYTYKNQYNFDLYEVYLKKITGKIVDNYSKNDTITVLGLVSKFKETKGDIVFSVNHNNKNYSTTSANSCKYDLDRRIINFDDSETGKLDLEFRSIDTKEPFNRPTNLNWSDGTDDDKDNAIVQKIIKERNNSYNQTSKGPIYRIVLTPSDIKVIRAYNKGNKYDNYEKFCDINGDCHNAFLYDLTNGTLNKYKNNGVIEQYGILKNKLETTKGS